MMFSSFGHMVKIRLISSQDYSSTHNMKSCIKYQVHHSTEQINFLDVTVKNNGGELYTTVFSKPTNSHLYLNPTSSHPVHLIKNIPKGQLTRLRRICSDTFDFITQSRR